MIKNSDPLVRVKFGFMSTLSVARQIAVRHIGEALVKKLEGKGVTICGAQSVPDTFQGDLFNTITVFTVRFLDESCVRHVHQLKSMACSSWTPDQES